MIKNVKHLNDQDVTSRRGEGGDLITHSRRMTRFPYIFAVFVFDIS
jgi:hypothetical protein